MNPLKRLIAKKPVPKAEDLKDGYHKTLEMWDLISIGVGGIIGAGIFVLTGKTARENAGPAVVLSYVIAGIVSAFSSLCYAELSSTLPVSGSAYSFTYIALGELFAWIIGWDLMLEYLAGGATVAVGWAGYLSGLQNSINQLTGATWVFDPRFVNPPFVFLEGAAGDKLPCDPWRLNSAGQWVGQNASSGFFLNCVEFPANSGSYTPAILNVPAFIISLLCTGLLVYGMKESARVNNLMVITKLLVVMVVIFAGIKFINPANYSPFIPPNAGVPGKFGFSGVLQGSISVFFAYIGFDSVSTVAQESKNPQRDVPAGILGSLTLCTILYMGVSVVLTGMVPYEKIDPDHAISEAFMDVGLPGLSLVIGFGALAGLTSVLMNSLIGQPRIFQAMAADGLFPSAFSKISTRGTPYVSTLTTGIVTAILSGILPVDVLGNLTSVGTLCAFFMVSISTMVMRYTHPDLPRKFKIPGPNWFGGYVIPGLATLSSVLLISQSTISSLLRIFAWMGIGLLVYFGFGFRNSKLGKSAQSPDVIEDEIKEEKA